MENALTEVARQLHELPAVKLLGAEDLEWSFGAPGGWNLYLEAERVGRSPTQLDIMITCAATLLLRRDSAARSVTIELQAE